MDLYERLAKIDEQIIKNQATEIKKLEAIVSVQKDMIKLLQDMLLLTQTESHRK